MTHLQSIGGDVEDALESINVPSYVIDRTGVVRHVYSSQLRATRHPREALMVLSALGGDGA